MPDLIGDVHGMTDHLEALLAKLGYRRRNGAFRHPSGRKALFVGDLVDRGPRQVDAVRTVRDMVEAGSARMVLGNHEMGLLRYATRDPRGRGGHYRPRRGHAMKNHERYIAAVGGADSALHREHVGWFLRQPLWLDEGDLRIVHACPHAASMARVRNLLGPGHAFMTEDGFHRAMLDARVFDGIEKITSGVEAQLPAGCSFEDANGSRRTKARIRWWREDPRSLADLLDMPDAGRVEGDAPPDLGVASNAFTAFGHYWMEAHGGRPYVTAARALCLDFSVAKGGPLCGYRFDGEDRFDAERLCWAGGEGC